MIDEWPDTLGNPKRVRWAGRSFNRMKNKYYVATFKKDGREVPRLLHRLVWERFTGKKIPKGKEIHHKDEIRVNNHPKNLEILSCKEHKRLHQKNRPAGWWKPGLEKARELSKAWHRSVEGLAWHRKHAKEIWVCKKRITKKCQLCNKTFETYWPIRGIYCSRSCSRKVWWGKNDLKRKKYNQTRNR